MRLGTNFRSHPHHITIPDHDCLRVGTLNAILSEVADYLKKDRSEVRRTLRKMMIRPKPLVLKGWERRIVLAQAAMVLLCFSACSKPASLDQGARVDRIVIIKLGHTMSLMNGERVIRTYKVALGKNPVGPKARYGDHKTPEGLYLVDAKKSPSRFLLALHLSYPNQTDRERAQKENVNPGSDVEIHGIENGLGWIGGLHRRMDWTDGCVAVTDSEIEEIWKAVAVGTPVEIRP